MEMSTFVHPSVSSASSQQLEGPPPSSFMRIQVMIVLEFLVNGDLRDYLIKNRPV